MNRILRLLASSASRGCALAASALLAPPLFAAEFSIQPDGSGDYPTIQAAVDAAQPLDVIILEDGLFTGPGNRDIRFDGKDVVVRSRNGAASCTIDTEGSSADPHRAFRLDGGETAASRIEGITITGGFVKGVFPESGGGGILVAYGSHPTITHCVFDANEAGVEGFGAGLLAWEDCDITLTDCVFVNGVSGWYGGGFVLRKFCDATVERVVVDNCYAQHGGGGVSITNSNPTVTDCVFSNNWVDEAGGGGMLVKAAAQPVFTRCVFAGNRAWTGPGIGTGNDPIVTVVDCLFEGNHSFGVAGAAVAVEAGTIMTITRCTFAQNGSNQPAQHLMVSLAECTVRNSIFFGGCTGTFPIYLYSSGVLDIDCSLIEGGPAGFGGSGTLVYGAGNVDADPMFCELAPCESDPWPVGDYRVAADSPVVDLPGCGIVGAFPVGCSVTSAGATLESRTWSSVKSLYRGGSAR